MTYEQDTLKSHYEFDYGKAKPNRFAARLTEDSLMVVLDPDMVKAMLDGERLPLDRAAQGVQHRADEPG